MKMQKINSSNKDRSLRNTATTMFNTPIYFPEISSRRDKSNDSSYERPTEDVASAVRLLQDLYGTPYPR